MRFIFLLFLVVFISACSTFNSADRKPGSEGANGVGGQEGTSGRAGKAGTVTISRGCDENFTTNVLGINNSEDARQWIKTDGDISLFCDSETLSDKTVAKLNALVDTKIQNMLASGYFEKSVIAPPSSGVGFEELKTKISFLVPLFKQLENDLQKDLGCLDGQTKIGERQAGKFQICFSSKVRDIERDGRVESTINARIFQYEEDGTVNKYAAQSESIDLFKLPLKCPNGALIYASQKSGRSGGKPFTLSITSSCDSFKTEYSAIYDNFTITY